MDKKAYIEKLHATVDQWKAKVHELKTRADVVQAEKKVKYEKQASELKAEIDNLKVKIEQLEKSGEEAFHKLKEKIDTTIDEIRRSLL